MERDNIKYTTSMEKFLSYAIDEYIKTGQDTNFYNLIYQIVERSKKYNVKNIDTERLKELSNRMTSEFNKRIEQLDNELIQSINKLFDENPELYALLDENKQINNEQPSKKIKYSDEMNNDQNKKHRKE
jgi:hypothetical protein